MASGSPEEFSLISLESASDQGDGLFDELSSSVMPSESIVTMLHHLMSAVGQIQRDLSIPK